MHRERQSGRKERQKCTEKDSQTVRQTERDRGTERETETGRQRERELGGGGGERGSKREKERQRQKQEEQRETETEKEEKEGVSNVCLMSQQCASASQGEICSDYCTCCHTETEIPCNTCYLIQQDYRHQANRSQGWPYNTRAASIIGCVNQHWPFSCINHFLWEVQVSSSTDRRGI